MKIFFRNGGTLKIQRKRKKIFFLVENYSKSIFGEGKTTKNIKIHQKLGVVISIIK